MANDKQPQRPNQPRPKQKRRPQAGHKPSSAGQKDSNTDTAPRLTPADLQERVLYRDALMLILNKPAGLPVHAGPAGGRNLEQYFDGLRYGLPRSPSLAHRLDRDTSGCLILGRHPKALRKLGIAFQDGRVNKTYWAIVAGSPEADSGRIELTLSKVSNSTGGWRMVGGLEDGQVSITDYVVRGRGDGVTWLELHPQTGRTHQIRVHCASALNCPLLGDPQYGGPDGMALHLHSRAISLPLYPKRAAVGAVAPVPDHMRAALIACGWNPAEDEGLNRRDEAETTPSPED